VLARVFTLAILLPVVPSHAAVITLQNNNSRTQIDPTSSAGQFNWIVDGTNHLAQQWFWIKVGAGSATPISSLSAPAIVSQTVNSVTLSYTGTGSGVMVQTTFTVNGGVTGSGVSGIPISISVSNLSAAATNISVFQFANFDLNASAGNDLLNIASIPPSGVILQSEGATMTTVKSGMDAFNQWQGGSPASVLGPGAGSVLSGSLGDSPALNAQIGPGDESWAVQWNATLAASGTIGSTFGVSGEDSLQNGVPGQNLPTLGDFNLDGFADRADLSALLNALSDLSKFKSQPQINGSELFLRQLGNFEMLPTAIMEPVDNLDLQEEIDYLANQGAGSLTAVPEPDSFVLICLGGAALPFSRLRLRRPEVS